MSFPISVVILSALYTWSGLVTIVSAIYSIINSCTPSLYTLLVNTHNYDCCHWHLLPYRESQSQSQLPQSQLPPWSPPQKQWGPCMHACSVPYYVSYIQMFVSHGQVNIYIGLKELTAETPLIWESCVYYNYNIYHWLNYIEFMSLVPLYSLTDSIKEGAPIAGLHVGSTEGDISQALRRFRLRYF